MRNILILGSLLLSLAAAAHAADTLREFSWSELKAAGNLPNCELLAADAQTPFERLKITNDSGGPKTITILSIDNPGVTKAACAVVGQVRYDGVEGAGCLEMWSHFPDGGRSYSRTLASTGLLQGLQGSSPWRPFSLPFFLKEDPKRPRQLVVNVVLPGKGTVVLGPLTLKQYDNGEDVLQMPGAWWSDRTGGWIGGIGGGVLGLLGAVVGTLGGMGKARRPVLGLLGACCVLGLIVLAVGIVALIQGQPHGVWYPLAFGGGLAAILFGALLPVARWGYIHRELRKMSAADAA